MGPKPKDGTRDASVLSYSVNCEHVLSILMKFWDLSTIYRGPIVVIYSNINNILGLQYMYDDLKIENDFYIVETDDRTEFFR